MNAYADPGCREGSPRGPPHSALEFRERLFKAFASNLFLRWSEGSRLCRAAGSRGSSLLEFIASDSVGPGLSAFRVQGPCPLLSCLPAVGAPQVLT